MDIEHVVVLMLENRSFDCMLGKLYPSDGRFDGLTGQETNVFAGRPYPVWASARMDDNAATTPDPDPGELFSDMNEQLFAGPATNTTPRMGGFAANYMAQPKTDKGFLAQSVMHYFTPEQVPVISTLARAFGVCDRWHASAPCQTWPNRFFAHTATSRGYVDNSKFPIPFPAPSIFRLLEDHGATWRVYFHDIPQSLLLGDIWLSAPLHYRFFHQFLADAATGALPNYSFVEPRYFTDAILRNIPNDEHPPHNVLYGEQLIAQVYNAVRRSPSWKKTLLVITYDEHGGCYDHVAPPAAVPPDHCNQDGFGFDRYGVRVPAVLISPFIPAGSIIRPIEQNPSNGHSYPFDHTSIIATLRQLFGLGAPLTARDAAAPHLLDALSLTVPANDGPSSVSPVAPIVTTPTAVALAQGAPNHMQANLARMAASLPPAGSRAIAVPAPMAVVPLTNVATTRASAALRVKDFLNA